MGTSERLGMRVKLSVLVGGVTPGACGILCSIVGSGSLADLYACREISRNGLSTEKVVIYFMLGKGNRISCNRKLIKVQPGKRCNEAVTRLMIIHQM